MLKRIFSWATSSADTILALALAVLVSILGLTGNASGSLVANATVATLAVLAFAMLRDRGLHVRTRELVEKLEGNIGARGAIRTLTGQDINQAIVETRRSTEMWLYRGPTATYTRVAVLPECIQRARAVDKEFRVRLEIIDPASDAVCERHIQLYRDFSNKSGEFDMRRAVKGLRMHLYATVVAVFWHKQRYGRFSAEVAFSENTSTFRWEASSEYFMITRRDERFPAMFIGKEDPFYDLLTSELDLSFRQARRLPLEKAAGLKLSNEPTADEVRALLSKVGIELPGDFDDSDIPTIIEMALHGNNLYDQD